MFNFIKLLVSKVRLCLLRFRKKSIDIKELRDMVANQKFLDSYFGRRSDKRYHDLIKEHFNI